MGEFSSTVRDQVRKLRRTADEKLLIKYGIVDEAGNLLKEGRFLVAEKVFAGVSDVRGAVLADLKDLEAEAEKAKKAK